MRRILTAAFIIFLGMSGVMGCKPGLLPTQEAGKPKVTLDRVEIQHYSPWTDFPCRTTLALGFIFNIQNPSSHDLKLEQLKFTLLFEAVPKEYLALAAPETFDTVYFPPDTVSQYRVVTVLDSTALLRIFEHADKPNIRSLNGAEVIKQWFTKIGDFAFGIKIENGVATFSREGTENEIEAPFEGKFPN